MIKLIASFDHAVDGKSCKFLMDQDTPIAIAKEMGFAFLKHLGQIEDQVKAHQAAQEAQNNETKVEEPPPEASNVE